MNALCFHNRVHAGQLLAKALAKYANRKDVVVLGLPRGGVPVAFEVAKRLKAPLDVMIVRKLGAPGWEELAMGAIASGGICFINERVVRGAGISRKQIDEALADELKELHRREWVYRGHEGTPDIGNKLVILVDDGIATGSTIRAAIHAIREKAPAKLVVAVPVAAPDTCIALKPMVDEMVCLFAPNSFQAVGQFYENFDQTTDAEVTSLLKEAAANIVPETLN